MGNIPIDKKTKFPISSSDQTVNSLDQNELFRQSQKKVNALHTAWDYASDDVILHCLPLHHVHGLVNKLIAFNAAGATVKMEEQFNAAKVLDELLGVKVNGPRANVFMAVPTIYVKLIEEAKRRNLSNCDFSYLRRRFTTQ